MEPIGDLQVPSFKVVSGGTTFTYASPKSGAASLDFLAHTLRKREANTEKTILICQQNFEAERLKFELAERDVNTILLPPHGAMVGQVLLLWSKGVSLNRSTNITSAEVIYPLSSTSTKL